MVKPTHLLVPTLLIGFVSAASAQSNDEPPAVQTIVVIDKSRSMADDGKLAVALDEIRSKAQQLPPSPATPWTIIPFAAEPDRPVTFTDGISELEEYLQGIRANGGTDIARALTSAAELVQITARHLTVICITDFEDRNLAGIDEATARLDAIFAERSQIGLGQHLIVKRWGEASDQLIEKLSEGGNVDVLDVGDATISHLTFLPTLDLIRVEWDHDANLHINVAGAVTFTGNATAPLAPIPFNITTPGMFNHRAEILPGDPPMAIELVVPAAAINGIDQIELGVEVLAPPVAFETADGISISTVALDRFVVSVPVPILTRHVAISGALVEQTSPRWIQPEHWTAEASCILQLDVVDSLKADFDEPLVLHIESDSGDLDPHCREITIHRPGASNHQIELQINLPTETEITVAVRAVNPPPWAHIDSGEVVCSYMVTPPPRVTTTISTRVVRVNRPAWIDLENATMHVLVDCSFLVDGPLGGDRNLTMHSFSPVISFELSDNSLRTGTQLRQLSIIATPEPSPNETELVFMLNELQIGAIDVVPQEPIRFSVVAPKPVQLFLQTTNVGQPIAARLDHEGTTATVRLTPVAHGFSKKESDIPVRLTVGDEASLGSDNELFLNQESEIILHPFSARPHSFFKDSYVEVDLTVEPLMPSAAIAGSTQRARLHRPAGFKRALVIALVITFSILLIGGPALFVTRVYRRATGADDFTVDLAESPVSN